MLFNTNKVRMDNAIVMKEKNIMIDQIKKYSPIFRRFFELDLSLKEYSEQIYQFNHSDIYIKRQEIVKSEILKKIQRLFGNDCQDKLNLEFDTQLACNIVDHHQFLNHPLLIADNIIANIGKFFQKNKAKAIVVISSGDVPPNNYFSKNGFQFHNKKVPLFSNSEKEASSCFLSKRDFDFVSRLKDVKWWQKFSQEEQNFLEQEYKKIKEMDFSGCENYNDQISVIVKNTWPYLFEEKIRETLPELLYITQEELTTGCLLKIINQDNFITATLFDKDFREKIVEYFRGIVVTWDEKENKGTHFFWRKHPSENKSLRMYLVGDKLVPADPNFKHLEVKLEKEEIIDLLQRGEIYPSLFIIFGVLNFYFGIKPLVGQGSLVYLNLIRDGWLKILANSKYAQEVQNMASYEIDCLIAGVSLFFGKEGQSLETLYAFDIIYNGGVTADYLNKIFNMKFRDLLSISVPGIYDYISQKYVPENEKIKPTVTSNMLAGGIINWL